VIEGALSVVPGQKVLLVADEARIDLGNALLDACQQRNADATLLVLEYLQPRPHAALHPTIEQHLAQVEASVFIAGFVEGEAQMRREFVGCTTSYQVRHAHMVGVSRRAMLSGLSTDPRRIATVASSVRGVLRPQSVFRVRSVTGTDLEVVCDPRHRWAEHSGIIRRGMWENLPTGELMTTPGNVHGVFVCDAAMSEGFGSREGLLKDKPVTLEIRDGYVRDVQCSQGSLEREVRAWLLGGRFFDRVGIISLGINIGISSPIGEVICDQNIPGLHMSLGATYAEETRADWDADGQLLLTAHHQDVDLDGRPLIRSGRYLNVR
jgi:leucyl aminopeptidase (aminopeptidase T)